MAQKQNSSASIYERMGSEPIFRAMLRFAMPAIVGLMLHAAYNFVDRIFVGQYVSTEALSAIAIAFPLLVICFSFGMMVAIGGASMLSIALGCKEYDKAQSVLMHAATAMAVGSLAFTLIGLWQTEALLRWFGANEQILPMASGYLRIILSVLVFDLLSLAANFFIRASGNPMYAMMTLLIGAVANIILDYVFIVHCQLGLNGAALATAVSQCLACAWSVGFFFRSSLPVRWRFKGVRYRWIMFRQIFSVGFSACIMELGFAALLLLMNRTMYPYAGNTGISALGIIFSLSMLLYLPIVGVLEGARPLLGYNYGAKQYGRVLQTVKIALLTGSVCSVGGWLLFQGFAEPLVHLFTTNDQQLIQLTVRGIHLTFLFACFNAVPMVSSNLFQAVAQPLPATLLSLCRNCVFITVPLLIFPSIWGVDGIWLSSAAGDILTAALGGGLLIYQWRRLKRMESELC